MSSSFLDPVSLPYDVTSLIIEATTDLETLDAWCCATLFSRELHKVALRARWIDAHISQKDVLSLREFADFNPSQGTSFRWATKKLYHNGEAMSPRPIPYMKHLSLDFDFKDFEGDPVAALGMPNSNWVRIPCSEDIERAVAILQKLGGSVKEIYHEGVLHQENLIEIVNNTKVSLEKLSLRIKPPTVPCRWEKRGLTTGWLRDSRYGRDHRILQWRSLCSLKFLRHLEIGRLFADEASSLASALSYLKNLKVLLVVAASTGSFTINQTSPLRKLLCDLCSTEIFPRLDSLTLSDPGSRHFSLPFMKDMKTRIECPNLSDIHLNIENVFAIDHFFGCLSFPRLRRLTLPSLATNYTPGEVTPQNLQNYNLNTMAHNIIRMYKATLNQVTFLNAHLPKGHTFDEHCDESSVDREGKWPAGFTLKEVVLGTNEKTDQTELRDLLVAEEGLDCPEYRFKRELIIGNFGYDMERLRIDQVNFYPSPFLGLFEPRDSGPCWFKNLKIFMLYPWSRTTEPVPSESFYPTSLESFMEGSLALELAQSSLPKLQVAVIGRYRFWFARKFTGQVDGSNKVTRIWYLDLAQDDPEQLRSMRQILSRRDWNFIRHIPPRPDAERHVTSTRDDISYANPLYQREPSMQMKKHWNYMVLLSKDYDSREPVSEGREGPAGKLATLATWDPIWQ